MEPLKIRFVRWQLPPEKAASALCGSARSIEALILFRVLQGVGGGMMTPVGTAMLFRAFPPHERAAASSVMAVPIALSPALGPVLGGWLVDYVGWRWIFWVNRRSLPATRWNSAFELPPRGP